MSRNIEIAKTIHAQIGGNRFASMTGAKNFYAIENGLQFDLPKTRHYVKDGISRIHIKLESNDLYTMTAYKIRGMDCKEVKTETGLYFDMLESTFSEFTGLATYL